MLTKRPSFFLLLLLSFSAFAQQQDSARLQNKAQSIVQKPYGIQKKLLTDTLSNKIQKKLARIQAKRDRAQQKVDKFKNKNPFARLQNDSSQKLDSLNPQNKLNQYLLKVDHPSDSLVHTKQFVRHQQKIDSVQSHLSYKVDDLRIFKLPKLHLAKSLDSLKPPELSDGADNLEKRLGTLQEKINDSVSSVQQKVTSLQSNVNKELESFKKGSEKLGSVNLPNANGTLPNFSNLGNGIDMPQLSSQSTLSGLPSLSNKVPGLNIPSTGANINNQLPVGQALNRNGVSLNSTLPSNDLKSVGLNNSLGNLSNVSNSTKEIGKYQESLKSMNMQQLNEEGLRKELETNAESIPGGKELETELAIVEQQKALIAKWNTNPEYQKEMAVTKAKEQAFNHFAGSEQELIAVMNKLTDLKSKSKDVEGVVDLYKSKTANSMKGKLLRERLDIGLSFQLTNRSSNLLIDFNPYVGYKLSGRFIVGTGWVQRLPFSTKNYAYIDSEAMFGFRSYFQFKIKGSSFIKFETELLNQPQKTTPLLSPVENLRIWRPNYLVGFKQSFKFSSCVGAHALLLYNLVDSDHQSPYVDKIQLRFGFEFYPKKVTIKEN